MSAPPSAFLRCSSQKALRGAYRAPGKTPPFARKQFIQINHQKRGTTLNLSARTVQNRVMLTILLSGEFMS